MSGKERYSNKQLTIGCWVTTFSAVALAISATVFRLLSLFFSYDKSMQYFSGGALPILFYIIYGVAIAGFAVASFIIFPKFSASTKEMIPPPSSLASNISRVVIITLGTYFGAYLIDLINNGNRYFPQSLKALQLPMILLSLFSIAFFFLLSITGIKPALKNATVVFGLFFIAWNILTWIKTYLDLTVPMNSPNKIVFHLAIASVLLFTVSELRVLLGYGKPRFYYFSLFTVITATSVSSVPSLTAYISGRLSSGYKSLYEDLIFLGVLTYALTRAFTLLPSLKKTSSTEQACPSEDVPEQAIQAEECTEKSAEQGEDQ